MNYSLPWYDSRWLSSYLAVKAFLEAKHPERLGEFLGAMEVFKTPPGFANRKITPLFDAEIRQAIVERVRRISRGETEKHELLRFGRRVLHNDEYFLSLQRGLEEEASGLFGEPVETCYNFLSLYSGVGTLGLHLDAPSAKWTIDYCVEQSVEWDIHVSEVAPWPSAPPRPEEAWADAVKAKHAFQTYALRPGEALTFAGSAQWHYREPLAGLGKGHYCHLLYFHFIPRGTRALVRPRHWPEIFNLPEMSEHILPPKTARGMNSPSAG